MYEAYTIFIKTFAKMFPMYIQFIKIKTFLRSTSSIILQIKDMSDIEFQNISHN